MEPLQSTEYEKFPSYSHPGMKDYMIIGDMDSDLTQRRNMQALRGQPWEILNLLPYRIHLYTTSGDTMITDDVRYVGEVPKFGRLVTSNNLYPGCVVHVVYPDFTGKRSGPYYEITRPSRLRTDSRLIRIGDIVSQSLHGDYRNSNADISGIRFHNHLVMPIDIYYRNLKIGTVDGDDGTDYMAASRNSVYLNNDYNGFFMGQEITFRIATGDRPVYATILLNDNYMTDVFIGHTSQKFTPPPPDTYAYRVSAPNITGITYYVPNSAYITQKTEPGAPF